MEHNKFINTIKPRTHNRYTALLRVIKLILDAG